jgi:hypothetical protein
MLRSLVPGFKLIKYGYYYSRAVKLSQYKALGDNLMTF